MQVAAEDSDRFRFRSLAQLQQQFGTEMQMDFHPPGPATDIGQPLVGRPAAILDPDMRRNHRGTGMRHNRLQLLTQPQLDLQDS